MMPSRKLIVYYFSGTGNSRNVAHWMAEEAAEHNMNTTLVDIAHADRLKVEPPDPDALVVFVSPIHGFNYPPVMVNFLRRFPRGKNRVVLMNTRAGMLIGKFITPGLTGIAFYFAAFLLWLKGYSIKAMYPVDLPSNWISVHPGLNALTVKYLHEKNHERVSAFAKTVFAGKSNFRALREVVQDILISPVALGYYFAGRFILAKTYYASGDCDNCNICIKGCPVKAIKRVDNRPFWTFSCESCMKCMGNCPQKAIETAHGSITGVLLVFYLVIMVLIYKFAGPFLDPVKTGIAGFILETVLFIALLAVWYRVIHYLMRFRFFERLMVYTSLTHFKFWGRRYKALSRKDYS